METRLGKLEVNLRNIISVTNLFWGCQNYTGDRLNFGLASEQAKSEGYNVEVHISVKS